MMDVSQLTPRRPYLLRAFYEWLLDNQLTPHLVVDVTLPGVMVPMEYWRFTRARMVREPCSNQKRPMMKMSLA